MKKIIKLLLVSIILIFSINISSTNAATYNSVPSYDIYNEHGGWGTRLTAITLTYLASVNNDPERINLTDLRYMLASEVCGIGAGGCPAIGIDRYVSEKGANLAVFDSNGQLNIGCGNGLLAKFDIYICSPDTTKPNIYAEPAPIKYFNTKIDIRLKVSDSGTGIEYSKYLWSYEEGTCKDYGHNFSNNNIIKLEREGTYTLTLCASDKGNECSNKNIANWTGTYVYDPEKTSCDENTLPIDWDIRNFKKTTELGGVTDIFSYDGLVCGYECKEGFYLDDKGTISNSDDECKLESEIRCDLNTKPSNINMIINGLDDGIIPYTINGDICNYKCETGYTLNDNNTPGISNDDYCINTRNPYCNEDTLPNNTTIIANIATEINQSYVENGSECGYKAGRSGDCTAGIITNECGCDLDMNKNLPVCNGGGKYCDSSTEPTNTNFMNIIKNAVLPNQAFEYNGTHCGYNCETNYILNNNGTIRTSDDFCESDIVRTLPGEIGIIDKNLLADIYRYRVVIPVGEDESPISYIKYQIELSNTFDSMSEVKTSSTMIFDWDMTNVDNDRKLDGAREYTFRLLEVCDKAGNCNSVNKDYIHKVYANTKSFSNKSISTNINGIADGTNKNLNVILYGKHGNKVVPASGISRTIDFNFKTINTLNEDQYISQRNAVYLSSANNNNYANRLVLSNNEVLNQLNNQYSTDGKYTFIFKIYAPTNEQNKFEINNLSFDINGELGNQQNLLLITSKNEFNFIPLYETKFSSEFDNLKSTFTQTGTITKEKIIGGIDSGVIFDKFILNKDSFPDREKKYSFDLIYSIVGNKLTTLFNFIDRGDNYLSDFKTLFIQSGLKYSNDGINIKYKSTKVGGDNDIINGVKILGKTNINANSQRDIIENQNSDDIHNLAGKIDKATLKRNIKRNAFKLTKGMTSGTELNGIKYLECTSGENKTLSDYSGTYILKGCNALIESNIKIGGIIVLKNSNGNGGMLYIDPSVTKIEAAIYVDKSIVSYRNGELSSNSNFELLMNQLYIYGAVFSENTIGGSLKTPPVCPYYVTSCTQEEAQKYDLNFLRSGFENNYATGEEYPVIIKYNPSIQTNPPKGFSK